MSISSIVNSVAINEYANPASRKPFTSGKLTDELLLSSKSLKSVTSEKINEVVSEKSDQNPNAVDYLRYQATATVANPEQSSRIYNETKKVKNTEKQKHPDENTGTDEEPEFEVIADENENDNIVEDNLGKGFFIVQPFEDDPESLKLIKKSPAAPLFQKIIDTYKTDEKREIGQLTDLTF
jgi:hypothetical protein